MFGVHYYFDKTLFAQLSCCFYVTKGRKSISDLEIVFVSPSLRGTALPERTITSNYFLVSMKYFHNEIFYDENTFKEAVREKYPCPKVNCKPPSRFYNHQ